MNKLITLAEKFETKLGLTSKKHQEVILPKELQKIAKVGEKLQKKIAQQYKSVDKVSGEVMVRTYNGKVPGIYLVCNDCEGRGKISNSNHTTTIKLASISEELPAANIVNCTTCNGKRVVKMADIRKCSAAQVAERAEYVKGKANDKSVEKSDKKKKKAARLVAKSEKLKMKAENPMAWKEQKMKKKADKKAKKAAKKAFKAVKKVQEIENN